MTTSPPDPDIGIFGGLFRFEPKEEYCGISACRNQTWSSLPVAAPPWTRSSNTPDLVSQEFKRLRGVDAVPGAAGWISLDPLGNPVNKAYPASHRVDTALRSARTAAATRREESEAV